MSITMEDPIGSYWYGKSNKDKVDKIKSLTNELITVQRQLNELRNAVSPGRLGFSKPNWWVDVATKMRNREIEIIPMTNTNTSEIPACGIDCQGDCARGYKTTDECFDAGRKWPREPE